MAGTVEMDEAANYDLSPVNSALIRSIQLGIATIWWRRVIPSFCNQKNWLSDQPNLHAYEEAELGLRLLEHGYNCIA